MERLKLRFAENRQTFACFGNAGLRFWGRDIMGFHELRRFSWMIHGELSDISLKLGRKITKKHGICKGSEVK